MKDTYLIISGTSKAATTSVFNYLANHPNICPSNIKQTNYFLETKVQEALGLYSTYSFDAELSNYKNYFSCTDSEPFKLEATPDYMYYDSTVEKLLTFTKQHNTKIIFILRNPVSRFQSWYNFGKQQGSIPQNMSFEAFYNASKTYEGDSSPSLMAHKTGFYSVYLEPFIKKFSPENLEIFFYEDLIENPSHFISNFCERIGLDSAFYTDFDFKHYNKTVETRSKSLNVFYNTLRSFYIKYLFKGYLGNKIGQLFKAILSPLYQKLNTKKLNTKSFSNITLEKLEADYKIEKNKIKNLTGETPW